MDDSSVYAKDVTHQQKIVKPPKRPLINHNSLLNSPYKFVFFLQSPHQKTVRSWRHANALTEQRKGMSINNTDYYVSANICFFHDDYHGLS